jgi:hypothetical protein
MALISAQYWLAGSKRTLHRRTCLHTSTDCNCAALHLACTGMRRIAQVAEQCGLPGSTQ